MTTINILLVEDDELDVMDIERSLDKLKILYNMTHVKNGEEALDFLSEKGDYQNRKLPDVVLLDINMPKMNGLELLAEIRKNDEWKHLKCFVITTSDEQVDRKTAAKLGVSGFIVKPLKLSSSGSMDAFNLMIDLMNFKSYE